MPRGSVGTTCFRRRRFVRGRFGDWMRRRSKCAAAFRDGNGNAPVIGKVLRGRNVRRLLYYLYGPGKANEHTDPHLVAGFSDPGELEPERRPDGSRDFRRLARLLEQPLAALAGHGYAKPVWHCAVRTAPDDRMLSDAEWAQVAARVMDRTGLAPNGDDLGCGGWPSVTPPITFTSLRRWPART